MNGTILEDSGVMDFIEELKSELDHYKQENEQLRQEWAPSTYNLFPECVSCTLPKIGACTIAGDCKSCSNPEVNKQGYTVVEYHNPEDVKALKMAREALDMALNMDGYPGCTYDRAIAAIDALGVGE
jgi:hypothetical protein